MSDRWDPVEQDRQMALEAERRREREFDHTPADRRFEQLLERAYRQKAERASHAHELRVEAVAGALFSIMREAIVVDWPPTDEWLRRAAEVLLAAADTGI